MSLALSISRLASNCSTGESLSFGCSVHVKLAVSTFPSYAPPVRAPQMEPRALRRSHLTFPNIFLIRWWSGTVGVRCRNGYNLAVLIGTGIVHSPPDCALVVNGTIIES